VTFSDVSRPGFPRLGLSCSPTLPDRIRRWAVHTAALLVWVVALAGCERTNEQSREKALAHARTLVDVAKHDVAEIRQGLPKGALELGKLWKEADDPLNNPEEARRIINRARDKTQDLRVAKATFFALAKLDGTVIRNDREQDRMAGKSVLAAFPALSAAARGRYVEALGVMPEAHGVKGKPDAEWVAATGVSSGDAVQAIYLAGWAWSSYAYRLEFALRGQVTQQLHGSRDLVPLLYAFVIVGSDVYGSPESPEVNAQALAALDPLKHLGADGSFSSLLEITNRKFALGVQAAPDLAPNVALAVLRSEL
jgi:hypothetical protein